MDLPTEYSYKFYCMLNNENRKKHINKKINKNKRKTRKEEKIS